MMQVGGDLSFALDVFDIHHLPDANATEVVVLDASSLSKGPVAVLRTARPVPVPVHASWSDTCFVGL